MHNSQPRSSGGIGLTNAALLVLAAAIYGAIFPVNRLAAEALWPPVTFAFLQSLFAGIVLAVVALGRGERVMATSSHLRAYLVIGGLVIGLPIGILVSAAEHLDASLLTLVLCLSPILTMFIGAAVGLERFDRLTLCGMLLGAAGIAVITVPAAGVVEADGVKWFLLALVAPVMFAIANNCAKWLRPPEAGSSTMAAGTLLGAAAVAFVMIIALRSPVLPQSFNAAILVPLTLATAINAIFFWLFFELVQRIGPARFSLFNYLAVAAGILWSVVFFAEQPAQFFWIALLLMFGGMHLALLKRP